jgi:hypothetical protein
MNAPDWIMTITTFFLGYALGKGKITKEAIIEAEKTVYKHLDRTKVGPVNRPDAEKLRKYDQPKVMKEADEAMIETLKSIPELNV